MTAETDVYVIGSGPAGSMVAAHALAAKGRTVTVLERGPYVAPADEVLGVPSTRWDGLADVGGRARQRLPVARRRRRRDCNGAVAHRLLPDDFELATRGHAVAGAAVADWPWRYADLEPSTTRGRGADRRRRRRGRRRAAPTAALRPVPHPPLVVECEATRRLEEVCARAGMHISRRPSRSCRATPAIASRAPRAGSHRARCLWGAKGSPTNTTLRAAIGSGRCTVIPEATALRLSTTSRRRRRIADARGRRSRLEATTFVLAAGAIFTPRLLLLLRSPRFASGLGNHADLVGRFLCVHPCPRTVGVFPTEIHPANTHYAVRHDRRSLPAARPPAGREALSDPRPPAPPRRGRRASGATRGPGASRCPPAGHARSSTLQRRDPQATARAAAPRLLDRFAAIRCRARGRVPRGRSGVGRLGVFDRAPASS